jgi:subtilisin-like proprotein convertase family protein
MKSIHWLLFFLFLFGINSSQSQTYTNTFNQVITDNNTEIAFDIAVSGLPNTIDQTFGVESVCLNITHTYDADLTVKLKAPDGTVVTLFSGVGGDGDNFTNTCLSGTGTAIGTGSAPFTGAFQTMSVLGNVNNGQNPNGTWQLLCTDSWAVDEGILIDWQLTFGSNPAQPFIFQSSNIPIVKLTTLGAAINNDTKVEVLMQIIDNGEGNLNFTNQTDYAYEGKILTEWQGFSGPTYPKKNYDFDLIDASGNKIDTSLLGMPAENDWIFKAEYLDHSLIKNTVTYEFARRMGLYAPHIKPCEIILDGEYIGYYSLTEKVKKGQNRLDIAGLSATDTIGSNLSGGYIIEMNINGDPGAWNSTYPPINNATCGFPVEFKYVYPKTTSILPMQANYIHDYVDSFENALSSANFMDYENGYRKFADPSSFIDFLIVNEFSVNYDSYGRSTYMYKEKDTDGGKLKIGPPWDYDRALDYSNSSLTSGWVWEITHPYWPFPFWWSKMYTDSDYKHELACRWRTLRSDELKTENFMSFIDSVSNHLYQAQGRNFSVWNDLGGQTYDDQINSLKSFLTARLDWIDQEINLIPVTFPQFYLPSDTVLCQGSNYNASFIESEFSYNWQPGPDSSLITFDTSGVYTLKVTDRFGCYSKKQMQVTISQPSAVFSVNHNASQANYDFIPVQSGASYIWNFGDNTYSSFAENPSHTFAHEGTYDVSLNLTDSIGCKSLESQMIQVNDASIVVLVYPNPFNNNLTVELNIPNQESHEIRIVNELGQQIFKGNTLNSNGLINIDASHFSAGVYFLEIEIETGNFKSKLVKI